MLAPEIFHPPFFMRSAHVQTILASVKFRARGKNPMRDAAREEIIDTDEGIRLLGFYSAQSAGLPKGLVILLHGWEGSSESTYILRTGKALFQNGYNVFRLNFRDHGESHHLNQGIFYAVLLEEVFQGVRQAARLAGSLPVFLVGFSLGGNFALRILRRSVEDPIGELRHTVSISPVLDPQKSTTKIDHYPIIKSYFLKKWRTSLEKKQKLFPDLYDFGAVFTHKTLQEVTDVLLSGHSDYGSSAKYFKAYSVLNDDLINIRVPTTIIAAADDPIIPIEDFKNLDTNDLTNLVIQPYGGHNGFLTGWSLQSWYEQYLVELFDEIVNDK
jgi:predicted alpha/beta-fold hydrolase